MYLLGGLSMTRRGFDPSRLLSRDHKEYHNVRWRLSGPRHRGQEKGELKKEDVELCLCLLEKR